MHNDNNFFDNTKIYDFTFIGAGPAATLTAIQILRKIPNASIAIIEKDVLFPQKVGESLADLGALFLRRFEIDEILEEHQIKSGLRFYFNDHKNSSIENCSDYASPSYKSASNGYQLNRQTFDQALLEKAKSLGATILRPASFKESIDQNDGTKMLTISLKDYEICFNTYWLIDASGFRRVLTKKWGWVKKYQKLETSASWAHFELKSGFVPLASKKDGWPVNAIEKSEVATEHFMGEGYWLWKFPIDKQKLSIGLVFDKNLKKQKDRNARKNFFKVLEENPLLKNLLTDYHLEKFYHRDHLPYLPDCLINPRKQIAGIGDSIGFVDPLFSPGLELVCQQSLNISKILIKSYQKKNIETDCKKYNQYFIKVFRTRFYLYRDRYKVMNDFVAFSLWTQMDLMGYLVLHVIPSITFPTFIKVAPYFNSLTGTIYKFLSRRILKLSLEKQKLLPNKDNLGLNRHSYYKIQKGVMRYFWPFFLLGIFIKRYLSLELNVFTTRQKFKKEESFSFKKTLTSLFGKRIEK